jgi:hypothetical protein
MLTTKGRLERKESINNLPASSSSISIFFRGSKVDKDSSADEGSDVVTEDVEVNSPVNSPGRVGAVSRTNSSVYKKAKRFFWNNLNLRSVVMLVILVYTINLLMNWLPADDLDEVMCT